MSFATRNTPLQNPLTNPKYHLYAVAELYTLDRGSFVASSALYVVFGSSLPW